MPRPQSDRVSVRFIASRRQSPWGVYCREWNPTTKQRERRARFFATEAEARAVAVEKEDELRRVTKHLANMKYTPRPVAAAITLREYWDTVLRDHLPLRKAGSYEAYERAMRLHVLPVAGEVPLSAETFTTDTVTAIVTRAREKGLSWGHQQNILKRLSAMLYWACPPRGTLLPANPVRGMARERKDQNWTEPEPNPLTYDEQRALLTWIETGKVPDDYVRLDPAGDVAVEPPRTSRRKRRPLPTVLGGYRAYFPFFLLLLHTGMRRGEAVALRWDSIFLDAQEPYLIVRRGFSASAARLARNGHKQYAADGMVKPKSGRERQVWLSRELADALRQRRNVSPYVFPSPLSANRPISYNIPDKVLTAALAALGLQRGRLVAGEWRPFTMHCLRDTFATVNLKEGTPLAWVSAMLGHRKRSITHDRYTGWIPTESSAQYVSVMERRQKTAEPDAAVGGAEAPEPAPARSRRRGESPALRVVENRRRPK